MGNLQAQDPKVWKSEQLDRYIANIEKALEMARKVGDVRNIVYDASGLALGYLKKYEAGERREKAWLDKAQDSLNTLEEYSEWIGIPTLVADLYNRKALWHRLAGESERAREYHEKDIQILSSLLSEDPNLLAESFCDFALYYAELGDDRNNLAFLKKALNLFTNAENTTRIADVREAMDNIVGKPQ